MKIVIDGRMSQESGIGRYIRNLLNQLAIIDKKNEYLVLLTKESINKTALGNNFKRILADFKWYGISEQFKLPKLLNDLKSDLVHFPHFNVPLLFSGRFVVTIHDLIHQHFQMRRATTLTPLLYKFKQFGYKKVFKNGILRSQKILVPSDYVKELLIDDWQVNDEKIVVTHEAVDDRITEIAGKINQKEISQVMQKFNINPPFIFYVGNAHPHKNVEGLIKAFISLRKQYQYLTLVLSGNDHYFWQKIKHQFQQKSIIFTGLISDKELVALYKSAKCFVMPSFEEGFGIPILEAMVCECPVVSSQGGALKEVGGDACLYFDPTSKEDIKEKIMLVLTNDGIEKDLIKKGQMRSKKFSWEKLAKQTMEVYQDAGSFGA